MRFWDANAVVPLLVREFRTEECRHLLSEDEEMVVWWATRSECLSALARKTREGVLEPLQYAQARVRLHQLGDAWTEVQPTIRVRALAEALLFRYPLRTADAYQLSAAIHWRENLPQGAYFVCYDKRLQPAAAGEGFTILPG